jgi:tRNA(Ile)-lysidine synthase
MLLQKVKRYIHTHHLLQKGDRVLVAVSGGPDSLCLLHILWRLAPQLHLELVAAHLDHGFRSEAGQEAEAVRSMAAAWSIPYEGGAVDTALFRAERKLTAQEAARIVRYRFLLEAAKKHGAGKIAVGHQQDDQAETVLFKIIRGTGPDGLAGMLPRRPLGAVELIRPLLGVARREIVQYCEEAGLRPVLDPSNLKTGYTRNRIRLELLPHLVENYNPRVAESLARPGKQSCQAGPGSTALMGTWWLPLPLCRSRTV